MMGTMNDLFFISSKIVQFLIEPLNIIFLACLLALILLLVRKPAPSTKFMLVAVFGFVVVGYAPIPEFLIRILENTVEQPRIETMTQEPIAGIIILGGAIGGEEIAIDRQQISIGSAAERVTKGLELIRLHPNQPFIYSGFSGRITPRGMSEADAFKQLVREQGLEQATQATAHYEDQSRNTYENAVYTKKIIERLAIQDSSMHQRPWLLVTSASHMFRSLKVFEKQGIAVIPVPVDYQTSLQIQWGEFNLTSGAMLWNNLLHEYIGILAYRLSGKI